MEEYILPPAYVRLPWIESTGTQWIETGIYGYDQDIIEIRGRYTSNMNGHLLGCHNSGYYRRLRTIDYEGHRYFGGSAGTWEENTEIPALRHAGTPIITYGEADTLSHTFIFNHAHNSISIDGTAYALQGGFDSSNRQAPGGENGRHNSMVLFAYRHDSEFDVMAFAKFQLEYAKFTAAGVTVREYIPAIRKADLKPGLFDTVSQTFFVNSASTGGDFVYSLDSVKTIVPSRYENLVWMKSNGTGVNPINVGSFEGKLKIEVDGILFPKIEPPGADDGLYSAAGTQNYGESSLNASMIAIASSQANHIMLRVNGSWVSSGVLSYERHRIVLEQGDTNTKLYVDDALKVTINGTFNADGKPIYIFGQYHPASSTIYSAKVYANNVLVRNLEPVYCIPDQKCGLYDKVNNHFYEVADGATYTYEKKPVGESGEYINYKTLVVDDNGVEYKNYKTVLVI